uniref:Uncharacterized protein n=1 Tax=viral metagenome TaxID=1070528 RepID=A0A6C0AY85_9ZZZZ
MFRIIKLIFLTNCLGFNLIYNIKNINLQKSYNVCMNYDPFKGYEQKLTIISSFQASIIINNWINYLSKDEEYDNVNEDIDKNPKFITTSIYDMKTFISINKDEKNTIIFAWSPDIDIGKNSIVYIVGGKLINNELAIHRIAQCPYYENILSITSKKIVNDIKNIVNYSQNITSINYDELHKYDNRYLLSWSMS